MKALDEGELGDYFPLLEGKEMKYKYYYCNKFITDINNYIDGIMYCKIKNTDSTYIFSTKVEGIKVFNNDTTDYVAEKEVGINPIGENLYQCIFPNFIAITLSRYHPVSEGEIIEGGDSSSNPPNPLFRLKRNTGLIYFQYVPFSHWYVTIQKIELIDE